ASRSTSAFSAERTRSSARPPISRSRALSCSSSSWKCGTADVGMSFTIEESKGERRNRRNTTSIPSTLRLSESSCHVVFRQLLGRVCEDPIGRTEFDEAPEPEERRIVRYARCLLHVVRHDDDRVVRLELIDQFLNALRRDRIEG